MTVQDFAGILRTRWKIICGTIAIAILLTLAYLFSATPQYEAGTRLYVTSTLDGDGTQTNNANLFAERQVLSYIELLMGDVLARRTIDKLGLDMSAAELRQEVEASAPTGTVVIDVTVLDSAPARARDIANTLSDEFVIMAAELSTPDLGARPNALVIVQQRANIPDVPTTPKKKLNLALAIVLGAMIGVVLAIFRERLDRTVKSEETIEKATGLGLIADIPFLSQRRNNPLILFDGDHSKTAESFRELRVNLQSLELGDGARVILVASPMCQDGRTMTAINLSLALAQADYNVVVVDGDFRRPRVASYLGIDEHLGLSTVLTGGAGLHEALQETHFARLTALTSGEIPSNPTELLGSQAAKDVLDELGRQFDYVVVDSPPLLVTDAIVISRSSQAVLMLARFGRTECNQLAHATNALRRAGAPLVGAVMTMTPTSKTRKSTDSYFGVVDRAHQDPEGQVVRWHRGRHGK